MGQLLSSSNRRKLGNYIKTIYAKLSVIIINSNLKFCETNSLKSTVILQRSISDVLKNTASSLDVDVLLLELMDPEYSLVLFFTHVLLEFFTYHNSHSYVFMHQLTHHTSMQRIRSGYEIYKMQLKGKKVCPLVVMNGSTNLEETKDVIV